MKRHDCCLVQTGSNRSPSTTTALRDPLGLHFRTEIWLESALHSFWAPPRSFPKRQRPSSSAIPAFSTEGRDPPAHARSYSASESTRQQIRRVHLKDRDDGAKRRL